MRASILILTLLITACGPSEPRSAISKNPLSVRGWVVDVKGAVRGETPEIELGRRAALFQSISLWVENAEYASGGIAQNGAFVILDVPPEKAIIAFNAPGAETAQLILENVPNGADVFIPDVVLEPGGATVVDPAKILVRVPADVRQPTLTDQSASIGGYPVRVTQVPLSQMGDRREFPNPGGFRPVVPDDDARRTCGHLSS